MCCYIQYTAYRVSIKLVPNYMSTCTYSIDVWDDFNNVNLVIATIPLLAKHDWLVCKLCRHSTSGNVLQENSLHSHTSTVSIYSILHAHRLELYCLTYIMPGFVPSLHIAAFVAQHIQHYIAGFNSHSGLFSFFFEICRLPWVLYTIGPALLELLHVWRN